MDNSLSKRAREIPDEARGRGKIFGMIGGQANPTCQPDHLSRTPRFSTKRHTTSCKRETRCNSITKIRAFGSFEQNKTRRIAIEDERGNTVCNCRSRGNRCGPPPLFPFGRPSSTHDSIVLFCVSNFLYMY